MQEDSLKDHSQIDQKAALREAGRLKLLAFKAKRLGTARPHVQVTSDCTDPASFSVRACVPFRHVSSDLISTLT